MQILIQPTTAAETSIPFTVIPEIEAYVFAQGLSGGEAIAIQRHGPQGWSDITADDATVQLTAGSNLRQITAPGTYRAVKPITLNEASVSR